MSSAWLQRAEAAFRTADLLALCEALDRLARAWEPPMRKANYAAYVKETMPRYMAKDDNVTVTIAIYLHIASILRLTLNI